MTLKKLLALALSLLMLFATAMTALAEGTTEDTTQVAELSDESVIATINGEDLTWLDVRPWYNSIASYYGSYYDEAWLRAAALENAIYERILLQKSVELKLDAWTDEEKSTALSTAQSTWETAIANYVTNYGNLTETSTDEDKANANAEAEAYYVSQGYSVELLADWERVNNIIERVQNYMSEQCAVPDEDVTAEYDRRVAADKELYATDAVGYETATQMAQYYADYGFELPLYRPAGFRAVKHIFLQVDSALMEDYTDKLARIEEQMDNDASMAQSGEGTETTGTEAEATAAPEASTEPEATAETPVTQADVYAAKQAILDSLKAKIDDIQTRIKNGEDFDSLVAEYGEDPGMTVEPTMSEGYSVHMDSTGYDTDFVHGSFSVDNIGDVTEPIVSSMGVHIIKYVGDVAEGAVELSEDLKATITNKLQTEKVNALYQSWLDASTITYSGLIKTMAEIEAAQATTAE